MERERSIMSNYDKLMNGRKVGDAQGRPITLNQRF